MRRFKQAHRGGISSLLVQRDDGKCNSMKSTRRRSGLHCHLAMSLMVETRLILLEDLHVLRQGSGSSRIKVDVLRT